MSDSQKDNKNQPEAKSSKSKPPKPRPKQAVAGGGSAKRMKAADKPAAAPKPKKAPAAPPKRTKPKAQTGTGESRAGIVELDGATVSRALVQDVSRQAAAAGHAVQPARGVDEVDDSILLEWQSPVPERSRRGTRPPDKRREQRPPERAVKPEGRRQDNSLLDIPAWPELSEGPVAPARPSTPPPPLPVQRPRHEQPARKEPARQEPPFPAKPAREFEHGEEALGAEVQPRDESELAEPDTQAGPPGEGPMLDAEGQPSRRRRRRRRRGGRHRGQNGAPGGEAAPQTPEGEQVHEGRGQQGHEHGRDHRGHASQPDRARQPERGPQPPRGPQSARAPQPERGPLPDRAGRQPQEPRRERGPRPERGPSQDREPRQDRGPRPGRGPRRDRPARGPVEELPPIEDADQITEIQPEEETWVEDREAPVARPSDKAGRLMLINMAEGDECRIAILHQNRLEELFIERASAESHVGNIYKGKITNVEPSIQPAFVDFGLPKNGFLHISDLQPQYFPGGMRAVEEVGRKTPRRERPPIQKCLRRGQEIIVQIIKEGIGTKGPTLTTYISIPGRYLVMMPGMNRLGVSRRIEDEDARRKMRSILDELELPKEMGFILRTAGMDRTKRELQQDLLYLQRLWKVVAGRIKSDRAPCELYRESDLVIRTIRDVFSSDFLRIIVDDERTTEKVRDFLSIAMPRSSAPVELYKGRRPLFHEYKLEQEIDRINSRYVPLPSGGSLVIESTEALVAIDVNSGRFRDHDDAEETAFRINIEAAEEIARQLRLRDLGGLILCDFIDMRAEKHRRGVERALRDALKKHKERAKCLRMSQFGIIEMTRQRMRPSIKRSIYRDCPNCRGTGLIKNTESMTLDIMRLLQLAIHHESVDVVEVRVAPEVGSELQNRKRAILHQIESESGRRVVIRSDENLGPDQYSFECFDSRGGAVRMEDLPDSPRSGPEARSKRRPGTSRSEDKAHESARETLEDVFD